MKKTLLALAVLGASAGVASAQQSNVTVYGIVDAGVQYKNDGNPAGKTLSLESGQQNGSRLGFKGTEDLGGGLSAIFTLENGFNVDDGTLGQGSRLFGRQAWVGLNGGFGTVKLGRQQTALYYALDAIDPFRINLAGNAQKVFGAGQYATDPLSRSNNTVSYSTATIGGFTGSASYGFGEVAGNNSAGRTVGAGGTYVNGPVNVQLVYQKSNTAPVVGALTTALGVPSTTAAPATADVSTAFVGATYDFRVVKAHLAYANTKFNLTTTSVKDNDILIGVTVPLTSADNVLASYIHNDVKDLTAAKSNQFALGYTHALSARTSLYTSAAYLKNDSSIGVNTGTNAPLGSNVRIFNVGMRHMF
jgi:predicted porin